MAVVATQSDRESFRRCRRQWHLQARMRRNLTPAAPPAGPDRPAALRAALSVYYFPGLWDWDRAITMPLVRQGLDRELARQQERGACAPRAPGWPQAQAALQHLLGRYAAWAPGADTFSPVLIDADFEVQVPDPARPGGGLTGADAQPVRFRGRIQMLAVDEHDAYWLVRHALRTAGWPDTSELAAAEDALADAWAWEQFYPGLSIAGTIHNELRLGGEDPAQAAPAGLASRSEPSRSSRSLPASSGGPGCGTARRRSRPRAAGWPRMPPRWWQQGRWHRRTRATLTAGHARSCRRAWPCARAGTASSCSAPASGPGRPTYLRKAGSAAGPGAADAERPRSGAARQAAACRHPAGRTADDGHALASRKCRSSSFA